MLNGQLIERGLVDELALTVAPSLVGGDSARVAHGDRSALTGMSLVHVLEEDGSLFLRSTDIQPAKFDKSASVRCSCATA